jgi:hypothetical protein
LPTAELAPGQLLVHCHVAHANGARLPSGKGLPGHTGWPTLHWAFGGPPGFWRKQGRQRVTEG